MWRGRVQRVAIFVCRLVATIRCLSALSVGFPVSTSPSSNPACLSQAPGFRTRHSRLRPRLLTPHCIQTVGVALEWVAEIDWNTHPSSVFSRSFVARPYERKASMAVILDPLLSLLGILKFPIFACNVQNCTFKRFFLSLSCCTSCSDKRL